MGSIFVGLFFTGVRYIPDINVLISKDLGPRCGSTVVWIYLLVGPWFCEVVYKHEHLGLNWTYSLDTLGFSSGAR